MTVPRHPGSRVVDQRPNLLRVIRRIEAELARVANRARPETLTFVPADPARGEPAIAAALTDVMKTLVYRSGDRLHADVACGTGTGSVMEVRLSVPGLATVSTAVTTAAGGTEQLVRLALDLPATWDSGAAWPVFLQARRVSGTDATTVRILRAWQR